MTSKTYSAITLALLTAACSGSGTGGTGGGAGGGAGGGSGGSGGGTGGGTTQPLAIGSFCPSIAQAYCARLTRCALLDQAQSTLCISRTTNTCEQRLRRVDAGELAYDGTNGQTCVNAFATQACAAGNSLPAGCNDGLTPNSALKYDNGPGDFCSSACATGFCPNGGVAACNRCKAYAAVGRPCDGFLFSSTQCDPATGFCPGGTGFTLTDGGARTCEALKANDQPCTTGFLFSANTCQAGLCATRADGGNRCGADAIGEACDSTDDCGPSAYCKGLFQTCTFLCTATRKGTCQPRIALGANCTNEQADDGCSDSGTCLDGKCVVVAPYSRTVGQECDLTSGQCVDGAFCSGIRAEPADGGGRSGTCTARVAVGASCTREPYTAASTLEVCASGSTCPNPSGTCQARQSAGGSCTSTALGCKELLTCVITDGGTQGRCTEPRNLGEQCGPVTYAISCSSQSNPAGFCLRDAGTGLAAGTCAAPLPNGAPCTTAAQCSGGRCFNVDGGAGLCQPSCIP